MIGKIILVFIVIGLWLTGIKINVDLRRNARRYNYKSRLVRISAILIIFMIILIMAKIISDYSLYR